MSWQPDQDPECTRPSSGSIELVVEGRAKTLPSLEVRRTLPTVLRRHVGPFVFLDHMGPVTFEPGRGLDVPSHPHIGLATVTYLYSGELLHRDSLGTMQVIRPGALNWMTAGRGIVHSERSPEHARGGSLHGLQAWVALPRDKEECEPSFEHVDKEELPVIDYRVRVIAGRAYGATSPVTVASKLFYVDAHFAPDEDLPVTDEHVERAAHVVEGRIECEGRVFLPGTLLVFRPGTKPRLVGRAPSSRVMLLGGDPLDGERTIYWNFVSSSKERVERAKSDWKDRKFPLVPGDEKEFVPLP